MELLKNVKNVKWFKNLHYMNDMADICHCPHCNSNVLVPVGATYCPCCGDEIVWIKELENEGIYEVDIKEFDKINPVEIWSSNVIQKNLFED